jgi:hypothetical protein
MNIPSLPRSLLISGTIATFVTLFGTAGVSSSELDLPGLNQRIDNIAARTTNNEADIKALQSTTQTAPAAHVDVPAATTEPTVNTASAHATPVAVTAAATPIPTPTPDVPVISGVRHFVSALVGPTVAFTCTWSSGFFRPVATKDEGQDPVCPAQ